MAIHNHNEAVYFIRDSLHRHIAVAVGTSPDQIQNGKTIKSYVNFLRYNTICSQVASDLRAESPLFSYPPHFIDQHVDATVNDFAYDAANIIFPPPH